MFIILHSPSISQLHDTNPKPHLLVVIDFTGRIINTNDLFHIPSQHV